MLDVGNEESDDLFFFGSALGLTNTQRMTEEDKSNQFDITERFWKAWLMNHLKRTEGEQLALYQYSESAQCAWLISTEWYGYAVTKVAIKGSSKNRVPTRPICQKHAPATPIQVYLMIRFNKPCAKIHDESWRRYCEYVGHNPNNTSQEIIIRFGGLERHLFKHQLIGGAGRRNRRPGSVRGGGLQMIWDSARYGTRVLLNQHKRDVHPKPDNMVPASYRIVLMIRRFKSEKPFATEFVPSVQFRGHQAGGSVIPKMTRSVTPFNI